jgi:hypothetical protein
VIPAKCTTSTDDWRCTRAAPQAIVAPAGSFRPYTIAINPTRALEMHQKNEVFKSIEDLCEARETR